MSDLLARQRDFERAMSYLEKVWDNFPRNPVTNVRREWLKTIVSHYRMKISVHGQTPKQVSSLLAEYYKTAFDEFGARVGMKTLAIKSY
jgi:hypothetical protein